MTSKKKPLSPAEKAECQTLKKIYLRKKATLGVSQESIGDILGVSQGAVAHYLNGTNALNLRAGIVFSDALQVPLSEFAPRLESERQSLLTTAESIAISDKSVTDLIRELYARRADITGEEMAGLFALVDSIESKAAARFKSGKNGKNNR